MLKPHNILNTAGYFNRHLELCKTAKTQEEAYELLEEEYKAITEKNKHASYDAFRMAKTRFFKKYRT